MKKYLILTLFLSVSFTNAANIYIVQYLHQADIKIYVVNHKWQADLLVYVVHHNYEAKDKDELWHFVKYDFQADTKIFFVDKK